MRHIILLIGILNLSLGFASEEKQAIIRGIFKTLERIDKTCSEDQ